MLRMRRHQKKRQKRTAFKIRKAARFCRLLQLLVGFSVIAFQQCLNVGFTIQHLAANNEIRQDGSVSVFLQGALADMQPC